MTVIQDQPANEIIQAVQSSGLEVGTIQVIENNFIGLLNQAKEWREKASSLVVTDSSQKELMKEARTARLALKDIRVEADKRRKSLKEDSIRYGKAVEGVYNVIEYLIKPIEKHLEDQEKFAEREAERKRNELNLQRANRITDEGLQFFIEHTDLAALSEASFEAMIEGAKVMRKKEEDRIEAERLAAIAKAEEEAKERARLKEEAAKSEAARKEAEAKLAEERKAAAAKAEEDRKERERLQAIADQQAAKAKEAAEALRKQQAAEDERKRAEEAKAAAEAKAKAAAERKAKNAPDRDKLLSFAKLIKDIKLPDVKGVEAQAIAGNASGLLDKVVSYIEQQTEKL